MNLISLKKHIPTFFTMLNLICGFSAILIADLRLSSYLLLLGMVFDILDGMLARMLKAMTDIGRELDSLSDLVSFGVAPAFLYSLMRPGDHWSFYIPPCILVIAAAYRLAIFNIRPSTRFFRGLATPACSMFLIGIFLSYSSDGNIYSELISHNAVYIAIPFILSMLMLSDIQMFSLKNIGLSKGFNYFIFGGILVFVALLIIDYRMALIVSVMIYIGLSLAYSFIMRNKSSNNSVVE